MATASPPTKTRPALGLSPTVESTSPVWLWPSLRRAASLMRVDPGALSRRKPATQPYGQERRLAPTLVLELCDRYYRRREIGDLAAALAELARSRARDADELELLEADLERYFAIRHARKRTDLNDAWLTEAQRRLPPTLYEQVVASLRDAGRPVESFMGARFSLDDDG